MKHIRCRLRPIQSEMNHDLFGIERDFSDIGNMSYNQNRHHFRPVRLRELQTIMWYLHSVNLVAHTCAVVPLAVRSTLLGAKYDVISRKGCKCGSGYCKFKFYAITPSRRYPLQIWWYLSLWIKVFVMISLDESKFSAFENDFGYGSRTGFLYHQNRDNVDSMGKENWDVELTYDRTWRVL